MLCVVRYALYDERQQDPDLVKTTSLKEPESKPNSQDRLVVGTLAISISSLADLTGLSPTEYPK